MISDSVHEAIYEYGPFREMAVPILYDVLSTQRTAAKEGRVALGRPRIWNDEFSCVGSFSAARNL